MKKKLLSITFLATLTLLTACNRQGSAFPNASFDVGLFPRTWASVRAIFVTGKAEIHQAVVAKNAAKTWRMKTEMRMHPGEPLVTTAEVACPDHEHMTGKLGSSHYEAVRIGPDSYVKSRDEAWQKSTATPDFYPCGDNPGTRAPWAMLNEGRDVTVILSKLVDEGNAIPIRGPLIKIDGQTCQEWRVQFSHPDKKDKNAPAPNPMASRKMSYSICIDTATHLPLQVVMGTGGVMTTYSDWNEPMNIQAPTADVEIARQ